MECGKRLKARNAAVPGRPEEYREVLVSPANASAGRWPGHAGGVAGNDQQSCAALLISLEW